MSVWIKASEQLPPLNEKVLILFKLKSEELKAENLEYATAERRIHKMFPSSEGRECWSTFAEYQSYYEVVYWARLYDKPSIEQERKERSEDDTKH